MRPHTSALSALVLLCCARPAPLLAQAFVEYPAHPATYGDHTIAATWPGGPVGVSVQFESDEAILHGDGIGQSQRTARNTLTFTPPSASTNPQDYDDPQLVAVYSARLPLLQQMSANGVSVLRYAFAAPVDAGFDLFVTDVDSGDSVSVSASGPGGSSVDMRTWALVAGGDLSLFKNTGTAFSSIVAPAPVTSVTAAARVFVAADSTNYNRSYDVLRAPAGAAVERVEVRFRGLQNSASRADGGTGSHVYLGLATTPVLTDVRGSGTATGTRLSAQNPVRGAIAWSLELPAASNVQLTLHDAAGRIRARLCDGPLAAGRHAASQPTTGRLEPGLYWLRLDAAGVVRTHAVVVLE